MQMNHTVERERRTLRDSTETAVMFTDCRTSFCGCLAPDLTLAHRRTTKVELALRDRVGGRRRGFFFLKRDCRTKAMTGPRSTSCKYSAVCKNPIGHASF